MTCILVARKLNVSYKTIIAADEQAKSIPGRMRRNRSRDMILSPQLIDGKAQLEC